MVVEEGASREDAVRILERIDDCCGKYDNIMDLPYHVALSVALLSGMASVPMVFHLPLATWFDLQFVRMDLPKPEDAETVFEVGAWTWTFMEPALGTASFLLLTLQVARAQMLNIGLKPYGAFVRNHRAKRVAAEFSQYERRLVMEYALMSR